MFDTSNEVYLGDPCKNLIIFFRNKRNLKIHFLKISDQVTKLQFRIWKKTHSKQHCATFTKTTHDFSPFSLTFVSKNEKMGGGAGVHTAQWKMESSAPKPL